MAAPDRAAALLVVLLAVATAKAVVPGNPRQDCDFGREPGYWRNAKFVLFNSSCVMQPIMEKLLRLQEDRSNDIQQLDHGKILTIGDSIDRKLISALAESLGQDMDYYAPFKYKILPSGRTKPEQTGKAGRVTVGPMEFANFFIFGAGDEQYYDLFYKAAAIPQLHNTTTERICRDAPTFTKPFMPKGPDMLILSSNFWDVARWWEASFSDSKETLEHLVDQYLHGVEKMMDNARRCFPHAAVYAWRSHPLTATDDRNANFASKGLQPHVIAALNQAGRMAAMKKDWVVLDMELMLAGRANEMQWMPDGLHPGNFALKEYGNMLLNVLYQAKKWKVPHVYGQLL